MMRTTLINRTVGNTHTQKKNTHKFGSQMQCARPTGHILSPFLAYYMFGLTKLPNNEIASFLGHSAVSFIPFPNFTGKMLDSSMLQRTLHACIKTSNWVA